MPEDCSVHIDDACIPCSWYLVRKDFNDSLVIATLDPDVSAPNNVELYYTLTIPPGSYDGDSLASTIKNLMPNHSTDSSNYAAFSPYEFDVSFFRPASQLVISGKRIGDARSCYFKVLTDDEITAVLSSASSWKTNTPGPIKKFYSLNTLLGNTVSQGERRMGSPFTSGTIDFHPIKYVLIRSPNFGGFMTVNSLYGESGDQKGYDTERKIR